jgi:hypothetical protein
MSNGLHFDWTSIVAERKIQEAIEAGEFENLEFAGKPLNLEENPYETFEQRVMSRALKNAKALPEWMQWEQDIRREVEALAPARERGLRAIRFAKNQPSRERAITRLQTDYSERLSSINTMLLKYNMSAPASAARPFRSYNKKQELLSLESAIAEAVRESEARETPPAPPKRWRWRR